MAVSLECDKIGWGIFTIDQVFGSTKRGAIWITLTLLQYRDTIARPGDGDPLPEFELNFNRFDISPNTNLKLN